MSEYPKGLGDCIVCDMTFPQSPVGPLYTPDFEGAMDKRVKYGVTFTSLTIASDEPSVSDVFQWVAAARRHILERPEKYILVERVADIYRAKAENKLAVNLHFQGSNGLLGDLNLVEAYKTLGVGHMILAYNTRNFAGDGCHEDADGGLSAFGRTLVEEMNRVRMVVDVSHTSYRTSMEAIEHSSAPVIMSHSNARAVFDHERNISDDQAKACAQSGGVIGINGVGLFLSEARYDASPQIIARHADYLANLVGPDHVGLGLDSVDDIPYFLDNFANNNREKYRKGGYLASKTKTPSFAGPNIVPPIAAELETIGWSMTDIEKILGGNWLRVLQTVWGD
jgi:membrane dipeptidase